MEEPQPIVSKEQLAYARGLDAGVKFALGVLVVGFICYLSGLLPSAVPLERLPDLWGLPVAQYLERAGMPHAWGWIAMLGHGDVLSLASIAFLLSISTFCLLLLLPGYVRSRDWPYLMITLAVIAVIAVAATGAYAAMY
jgi:hypothetical protein